MLARIVCWLVLVHAALGNNQTVSIQNTNETFYTYVPFTTEDCVFSASPQNLLAGDLLYVQITQSRMFTDLYYEADLVFWSLIRNGLKMYANQNLLFNNTPYNQVVLFNSSIYQAFNSRQLILSSFLNQSVVFTYLLPFYNKQNQQYSTLFVNNITLNFTQEINNIITQCDLLGQSVLFVFGGEDQFIGYCPNTNYLFFWDVNNATNAVVVEDLPNLNNATIANMTNNPDLLLPFGLNLDMELSLIGWNVLLFTSQQKILFCYINFQIVSCDEFQSQIYIIQILAARVWGLQNAIQTTAVEVILTQYPFIQSYDYPGKIISIFTISNTIFIQSTYLQNNNQVFNIIIFQSGVLLANVTLIGAVVFYSNSQLIVQDGANNQYYLVNFLIPLYIIESNGQSSSIFTAECFDFDYSIYYEIVWSNIEYPMYQIIDINEEIPTSYVEVFISSIQVVYQVIGPAFDFFIQDETQLTIELVNQNQIALTQGLLAVVNYAYNQINLPRTLTYLNQQGQVRTYDLQNKLVIATTVPCNLNNITHVFPFTSKDLFYNGQQGCLCTKQGNICSPIPQEAITQLIYANSKSKSQYFMNLQKMSNIQNERLILGNEPNTQQVQIKTQLLQNLEQGLIINIYENNTIILTNLSNYFFYAVQSGCSAYNSTNGIIFKRNLYCNNLITFCYNSSYLTQYFIRDYELGFNRVIPLYGFQTRDHDFSALSGKNFLFLEVYLNVEETTYQTNLYSNYCCILRLDPTQFTVSVIVEIIQADKLILVQSIFETDIAVYNSSDVTASSTLIKIYLDSSYIIYDLNINCGQLSCAVQTYKYSISFISNFYNFAAYFDAAIEYNVTQSMLISNGSFLNYSVIVLGDPDASQESIYSKLLPFNFNSICGPIAQYSLEAVDKNTTAVFTIRVNKIIDNNKLLQDFGSTLLQIIDIHQYILNNTLSKLIIVVTLKTLTFFIKYNNTWMEQIAVVEAVQMNCFYYVYQVVNYTTISFASNCINYHLTFPFITITYEPQLEDALIVTSSYFALPIQLRDVTSVLQENSGPIVLGLGYGPSKSLSGTLFICNDFVFNILTSSIEEDFIIDFNSIKLDDGFMVVALDLNNLIFWINPTLSNSNSTIIQANYMIPYRSASNNLICTKVKFVFASSTSPSIILSCNKSYIQIDVDFEAMMLTPVLTYAKFANCEDIDKFKPDFIVQNGTNSTIIILIAECARTLNTFRVEQLQTVQSQDTPQFTGFIQVYTPSGPMCKQDHWYPIEIIPLSMDMRFELFTIYFANNQFKLLYQTLPGILIDTFINLELFAFYQVIDLSQESVFPLIRMNIRNPYSRLHYYIITQPPKNQVNIYLYYLLISFFIFLNVITLACLAFWLIFERNAIKLITKIKNTDTDTTRSPIKSGLDQQSFAQNSIRLGDSKNKGQKKGKRLTEIELFQPR